jgi:hypothetical protein
VVDAIDQDEPPSRRNDDEAPRPRRKKHRRRNRSLGEVFASLSFPMLLACLLGITIVLIGLQFVFRPFFFVTMLLGLALLLFGRIWFLLLAFRDSVLMGLGCLLVPFVDLVFLIRNWHETWRPFTLNWTAILLMFLAGLLLPKPEMSDIEKMQQQRFEQHWQQIEQQRQLRKEELDLQRQRMQQQQQEFQQKQQEMRDRLQPQRKQP